MSHDYFVYHIQLNDQSKARIQKLGPGKQPAGEPTGSLGYSETGPLLVGLLRQARAGELDGAAIAAFGADLFGTMFDAGLARDFFDFYDDARRANRRVRVELDISDLDQPQLASLPWELLRAPPEARHGAMVFATDPGMTLVRRRARPEPPKDILLPAGERLRIAVAVASPDSTDEIQLGPVQYLPVYKDLQGLAARYQDRIELLDPVENATAQDIDRLLSTRPHIFHFVGHGWLHDTDAGSAGEIVLSDGVLNLPDPYLAAEFGELFSRHTPSIILLHSCEGAASATGDAFASVASHLVEQGIPVVVAMQFSVSNSTARRFASKFYTCLAQGDRVDEAVQEGRRAISLDGAIRHRTRDFATPVVYSRVEEGRLVDPTPAAAGSPGTRNASLSSGLKRYLTWVNDRFGQIELRGIRLDGHQILQLDLDAIYVPLEATAYVRRAAGQPRSDTPQATDIDMSEMLSIGTHLVLSGGPGSGKTTVLLHIVHTLAESLVTNSPAVALDRLGLEGDLPLPIFIPLSAYSSYLKSLDENPATPAGDHYTLAAFISRYLKQQQIGTDLSVDFFEQAMLTGTGIILLLDGLDEVANESDRIRVRQAIENLVTGRPAMRVVVSCRTAAHRGRTALGRDFREVRVKPLTWEYVVKLVEQAYRHIFAGQPELGTEKAIEILRAIANLELERLARLGPGTPLLIDSPLLLRLLFIVHHNNYELPAKRAELYLMATDAMLLPDYGPDEEVSESIGRLVGGDREPHRELVKHLAFHMHTQGSSAQEGREIDEFTLREVLQPITRLAALIDEFIALTRLRGTLLEERLGQYRFIHLAFQEFLAGRYLAENILGKKGMTALLEFLEAGPLTDSWWREPVLLLIGFLTITLPRAAETLLWHLLGQPPAGTQIPVAELPPTTRLSAIELAATALLEWDTAPAALVREARDRLAGYFAGDRAELSQVHPRVRASAGVALGVLGDHRAAVADVDGMEFCAVPRGPVTLGSAVAITDDDRARRQSLVSEQHVHVCEVGYDYWLGRFPVTNAQYQPFVADGGYEQEELWVEANANGSWRPGEVQRNFWQGQDLQSWWETGPYDYGTPYNLPNHAIVGISWYEGLAFMRWLARRWQERGWLATEWTLCFPSEPEWEKAARGGLELPEAALRATCRDLASVAVGRAVLPNPGAERSYPWPGSLDLNRLNALDTGIRSTNIAGCFPEGVSPYGCEEMSGGVWEWTRTLWGRQRPVPSGDIEFDIEFEYPYSPDDGREDLRPDSYWLRVARGGAHNTEAKYCRSSFRDLGAPNFRFPWDGLRIAIVPAEVISKNSAKSALQQESRTRRALEQKRMPAG
jgi:formylglycine-generating enzyme required for sulfatase activity